MKRRLGGMLLVLLLLCGGVAVAQRFEVRGVVRDAGGDPISGAYVQVKGQLQTRVGTDEQGRYKIQAAQGATLEVSALGMKTAEAVASSGQVDFKLEEDLIDIEGVVVTGYQEVRSRAYTGAAASVKMQDVKLSGVPDMSRMLEGRIPGLAIQNVSGNFGAAPRINIRGGASIMGNAQPLWVIDGAVHDDIVSLTVDELVSGDPVTLVSSAIAGLNSSDIEDIQVLKDASATSMYGARALNGVIVVTTKSGKQNAHLRVNYSYELSMRAKPSYSEFDLLNSAETMALNEEMDAKGYFTLANTLYGRRSGVYYQWYKGVSTIDPATGRYYLQNTPAAKAAFFNERGRANTDWFDELFTYRPTQNHTLSISAGGKHTATYASLGYYNDMGWTLADRAERITAKLKTKFFITSRLDATLSLAGNMRDQLAPGTFSQRKNHTLGGFSRDFDINPFSYAIGTPRTLRPRGPNGHREYYRNNWAPFNILDEFENNYIDIRLLDFRVQADASYRIIDGLKVRGMITARRAQTTNSHYVKEKSNVVAAFRANETPLVARENIYLLRDRKNPNALPGIALTHGGIFSRNTTEFTSYQGRISLDFERQLGMHGLKAFGFVELRHADRVISPFTGYGIQYAKGNQVFTNPDIFRKLQYDRQAYFSLREQRMRGITLLASATYEFDERYVLNGVLNMEGSNAAGASSRSRWFPTWNIGAKWNIDRENFFDVDQVTGLSLRASYGLTAKMNENALNSSIVYENTIIHRNDPRASENALRIKHLENQDLTWEKMYEFNLGADAALFDNAISFTADVYQRNSFDLIDQVRTSGVGGEYYKYANLGDMRTRGLELALETRNVEYAGFKWVSKFTFSYVQQRITNLRSSPNTFDLVSGTGRGNLEGYPKGALFSFNYQGLNRYGLPTFDFGRYPVSDKKKANIAGADFLDTEYSKSYLIYEGSVLPNIIGGVSNSFSYKNFTLSLFVSVQAGNKIRLNPTFDPSYGDLNVFSSEYYDRWQQPGDELRTEVPTVPSQDLLSLYGRENIERAYNTYNYSHARVVDGSFVRLKNVSLTYDFPRRLVDRVRIHHLRLGLQATNLWLIYADKRLRGQDPEFYRTGGVALPTPRQLTFSLNVGF